MLRWMLQIVAGLKELVKAASAADGCDHSIRLFLDALLKDEWLTTTSSFAAFTSGDERLEKPLGFLFAYYDGKDEAERPQYSIVAIVHPVHRRSGVFRRMVIALKA